MVVETSGKGAATAWDAGRFVEQYGESMGRWLAMVQSVDCLRSHALVFDAPHEVRDRLKSLALCKGASDGERMIAAFCVGVFQGESPKGRGWPKVDVIELAGRCDETIREAVAKWIEDPFWP